MSNFNNHRATYQAPYWPPMPVQYFPQLPGAPPPAFNTCQYWSPGLPVPSVAQFLPPPPSPTWNIPPPPVRIRQRIAPIYSEKSPEIEAQMIQKMHAGDYVASVLSDKLNEFLIARGKITRSNSYDFQRNLYILLDELRIDPNFLPSRSIPIYQVTNNVKNARNALEHDNWDMFDRNTEYHMDSMRRLSRALGERGLSNDIYEISNAIKAGDCSGCVAFKPFRFPRTGAYCQRAGVGLKLISKSVLETYFVKNIWRQRQDRFGAPSSSLDVYENNLDMIDDLKSDPRYLVPGSQTKLDLFQETRLDLTHGRHEKFFRQFKLQYDNMVDYLWMLGEADAAIEVALIRDLLIELKRTGKEVKPSYFPSLFPQA
jgi:hypothetical protein